MKTLNLSTTIHIRTLKVWLLFSIAFLYFSTISWSQDQELSMIFVGDVMQHDGQIQAAYNKSKNTYEYEDGFKYIKPVINEYDLRIANLEVTLAGKPFKGYPQFSAPDELATTLVNTGFNIILTSNNHSCDRGSKGVIRTLDKLDELGVLHTGTFRNKEERSNNYPLIVEQKGMKVAMLNYTYGTNGIFVDPPLIVNYIDSNVIRKDVERAKELGADYIICNMHWGKEYKLLPNNYQKKYEEFCYRVGIDMVMGGHPHVVQPIQKKTIQNEEKLTVWSLGNFVSNMQTKSTRGGVMVGARLKKESEKVVLGDVDYHLIYVLARQEGAIKQYYILPDFDYNKYRSDFMTDVDLSRMKYFFDEARDLYTNHNVGTKETIISPSSSTGQLYIKYLTQYYSVMIPSKGDELLMNKAVGPYLHETVDNKGKCYILSGICSSKEQAVGNLHFIEDCNLGEQPKLVLVKPGSIEMLEE